MSSFKRVLLTLLLTFGAAAWCHAQYPPAKYSLLFSDTFDGDVLDQSKWTYRTGTPYYASLLPEEVSVSGGYMSLSTDAKNFAGKSFATGGIISRDRFRYGYYELKSKVTANPGWHTSFWVLSTDPKRRTEIDGYEINTESPNVISSGVITYDANGNGSGGTRCNNAYNPGFSTAAAYHWYGFEWTEAGVSYYIDGTKFCTQAYPPTANTHDQVNLWLTSVGYRSNVSVVNNPSPNSFGEVYYYVRDYYINANETGYAEYGSGWADSSLLGYSQLATRVSNSADAIAQWAPTILTAGTYDVQIWKTQLASSDPAAPITINYSGGKTTRTTDFTSGTSGWVDLGSYSFAAGSKGNVTMGFSGTGYARTSMVKFVQQ